MKMTSTDFKFLEERIKPLDTPELRMQYEVLGYNSMRYRWDLLRATGIKIGDGAGMRGDINLYSYLNDDHIDTALRAIVPPLEK